MFKNSNAKFKRYGLKNKSKAYKTGLTALVILTYPVLFFAYYFIRIQLGENPIHLEDYGFNGGVISVISNILSILISVLGVKMKDKNTNMPILSLVISLIFLPINLIGLFAIALQSLT